MELGLKHALAAAVRAHQHVEIAVAALEEGELVDRRAAHLERAGRRAVEGDAEEGGVRRPYEHRARRDEEHASGGPEHRGALAGELALREIADRDAVQRDALRRIERVVGAVDARRRSDAPELAFSPLAHGRKLRERVAP